MATEATSNWLDDLKREFPAYWREIPHKWFFFSLLALWLALFHFLGNPTFGYVNTASLLTWLYNAYSSANSEDSHGLVVPILVLGLLWYRRNLWGPVAKDIWPPALVGVVLALLLHMLGYLIQQPIISTAGLLLGVVALTGLTWGKAWLRKTWFPFVLLIFCIPLTSMADALTLPLRVLSTKITVFVCHYFLSIQVLQDGVILKSPKGDYTYELVVACSGIRSLVTLLALTTIYGMVTFTKYWKQILCVSIAAPLAVAGNVMRLSAIIVAREAIGEKAAHFVHEWFGFVTFAFAIVCVMLLGAWLREDNAPPASSSSQITEKETNP